ncbi:MAG: ribonuclease E/G [Acidobacteriota bacterium]
MAKAMLINVTQAEESRVAIVRDGTLEWIEIETGSREKLKGNIYKGSVESVNSALQAAFVSFHAGRAGFLPLDEINFRLLPPRKGRKQERKGERGGSARPGSKPRITDLLQPGQEILVQVVREQYANKPPTLSIFFSLPGRYLVLLPGSDSSGISRKIEDEAGRESLKKILKQLNPGDGLGIIVRTAGLGQTPSALTRDMRYLTRLWRQVEGAAKKAKAPALIYRERDLVLRAIRDLFTPDIREVILDDEETYKRAVHYFRSIMPGKQKRVKLYSGDQPLFSCHDLEQQIETIYKRRVPLKSGGAIVIDETEALTSIDVNSGKTREANIEETALKTNLEAAGEIARQLRLRDIGGLIVIDFIDMRGRANIRSVEKRLREAIRGDKARSDLTRISKLGLLEMSRQRMRATTASSSYMSCEECEGSGVVKTVESAGLSLLRRIHSRTARGDLARIKVMLPSKIANYLLNRKREELARLEERYHVEIQITGRNELRAHDLQFEVESRSVARREEMEARRGQEPRVKHPEMEADSGSAAGEEKRRRVRRRRRTTEKSATKPVSQTQDAGAIPAPGAQAAETLLDQSREQRVAVEEPSRPTARRRRPRGGRGRRGRGPARRTTAAKPVEPEEDVTDHPEPPDCVSGPEEKSGAQFQENKGREEGTTAAERAVARGQLP